MNQILSVENNRKEKQYNKSSKGPIEISKIVKFFSIVLMLYGIFIIGTSSYSMYKDSMNSSTAKALIFIEEPIENQTTIKIDHKKQLAKLVYSWNNQEQIEVQCNGNKKFQQKIDIPTGTNTLNISVIDINGQESKATKTFTIVGDITIDFAVEGNGIKVTAEGKNELSYLTYRWDEEEETKVDINDTNIEQTIDIPKGLHTLTVIVVDVNNKTETKEQEVQGVTKPKVEVTTDGGDNFIIHATDEQGLKKVEFIINEDEKNMLNLDGRTELEYKYPLHDGENRLEIRVYNVNDVCEVSKVLVNK